MTTTAFAPATASEAQIKYIQSLLSERVVDAEYAQSLHNLIAKGELRKSVASNAIGHLMTMPRTPKRAPLDSDPRRAQIIEILETVPKARYAIPTSELPALFSQNVSGDLLFVRVSEYRGQIRFARLHGAPGDFTTSRVGMADTLLLAKMIERNPARFTKMFADHYSVCGKCLAPLTDQTSRELGLGPICAKAF